MPGPETDDAFASLREALGRAADDLGELISSMTQFRDTARFEGAADTLVIAQWDDYLRRMKAILGLLRFEARASIPDPEVCSLLAMTRRRMGKMAVVLIAGFSGGAIQAVGEDAIDRLYRQAEAIATDDHAELDWAAADAEALRAFGQLVHDYRVAVVGADPATPNVLAEQIGATEELWSRVEAGTGRFTAVHHEQLEDFVKRRHVRDQEAIADRSRDPDQGALGSTHDSFRIGEQMLSFYLEPLRPALVDGS